MAGFVKGMIPAVQRFVAERRERCAPTSEDPDSFGRRVLVVPPSALEALPAAPASPAATPGLPRRGSLGSCDFSPADCARTGSDAASLAGSDRSVRSDGVLFGVPRGSSMRRLGAMMLASGVAIALARTASTGSLPPAAPSGRYGAGSSATRGQAQGKRHGSSGSGGSSRHHGQRRHSSHGARGGADEAAARRRRRQQLLAPDL